MKDEITVLITGDFYGGNRIDRLINEEKYSEIFNDFLPFIQESDISITNLESALTTESKSIYKTGPAIKASPKTINALKFAGFNLLTLANNHIMDFGEKGLIETLNLCKANEIDFVGAGKDLMEASSIFYKEIKGKKLAFINISENEWSTTNGSDPGANPMNPITNYYSIKEAGRNADFVFVIVHGGHEMYQLPSPRMKQFYRFFADAGAHAVIGHHTHCYSGYEIYNGSPIFYSLGNFIFDTPSYRRSIWNHGFAVSLRIDQQISFEIIPYMQNGDQIGIHLLDNDEKIIFENAIKDLNKIILNDKKLKIEFNEFCNKVKKSYNAFLEPHSLKYLYTIQNRGFFPSMLSCKKRLLYQNLIRCEAHRDIVLKLLTK